MKHDFFLLKVKCIHEQISINNNATRPGPLWKIKEKHQNTFQMHDPLSQIDSNITVCYI